MTAVHLAEGHTYRARLVMHGFYVFASSSDVRQAFERKGFMGVHVTSSRPAAWTEPNAQGKADFWLEGTWPKPPVDFDTSADRDAELVAMWDVTAPAPLPTPGPDAATAAGASSRINVPPGAFRHAVDVFPTWVSWDDVHAKVKQIDSSVDGLNAEVDSVRAKLPEKWVTTWDGWRASWRAYRDVALKSELASGDINAKASLQQAESYETDLAEWRKSYARVSGQTPITPNPAPLEGKGSGGPDWGAVAFWAALGVGVVFLGRKAIS